MSICCIFNYPPHYRKAIYHLMDEELACDFYFGDRVPGKLEKMDVKKLKGFKGFLENIIFRNHIIWQRGIFKTLKGKYNTYLLSVDTASLSNWIFVYFARLLGRRVYFWTHGAYGDENFLQRLKAKLFFLPANGLFVYGEYAKTILVNRGYNKNKIYVIANSLDSKKHLELRRMLTHTSIYSNFFKNHDPVLLFIGRLEVKKRLDILLQAIKRLEKEKKFYNCVFIGDGEDRKHISSKIKRLELENRCWLYGACYDEDEIAELIYNADVCISPGNVGLTAVHCLSFGLPVITHSNVHKQMPEFEAIVPYTNGMFFRENDIDDLIRCIKEWFERYPNKTTEVMENCFSMIDKKYNTNYQLKVLSEVLL